MASTADQPPTKTYRGNCHCGAFVYEAQIPEIKKPMDCNCSYCHKKGYLFVITPQSTVKIVKGDESALTSYQFGAKNLQHMFCPTCGSPVLAKGDKGPNGPSYGLNIHCIQGIDTWTIERNFVDGAAQGAKHEPPVYSGPEPTAEVEGSRLYSGSCHCGAVTMCLRSKPIDETYAADGMLGIIECNCSICERFANVWVYPSPAQVVMQGQENLTRYTFATMIVHKEFCRICGVNLSAGWTDLSKEQMDALPEDAKRFLEGAGKIRPVNLRVLDNFSLKGLKIQRAQGKARGAPYVDP